MLILFILMFWQIKKDLVFRSLVPLIAVIARLGVPVGVGNDVVRVYRPSTRTLILGNSHNDFPDSQASPSEAWRKE